MAIHNMMNPLRGTAYAWHGGQGSPLYQFASIGGIVINEEHREALAEEIEDNIVWCETNRRSKESKDNPKLEDLLEHIRSATIGEKLPDPD